jgi:hypothetical protein
VAISAAVLVAGASGALLFQRGRRVELRRVQTECRANLSALLAAQSGFYERTGRFAVNARELGFSPALDGGYRYLFENSSRSDVLSIRNGLNAGVPLAGNVAPGVSGRCPDCSFVAACIGQIDEDPTHDVWSVSSRERITNSGQRVGAAALFNDIDDLAR